MLHAQQRSVANSAPDSASSLSHTVNQGPRLWRLCHLVSVPFGAMVSVFTLGKDRTQGPMHLPAK